jgi:hypothetical protein
MRYLLLLMIAGASFAQQDAATTPNGAMVPIYGLEKCDESDVNHKSIADFTKSLKSGELISAKDLVGNPNFLNPCFKELAGIYASSFDALLELSNSIGTYNQSELNNINKVNSQLESLGGARNKTKAKKDPNAPTYSSSFINFKNKGVLVGTVENETGFVAHIRYSDQPINSIKVGDVVKGVEITNIEAGRITYKDRSASRRSGTKWTGG